MTSKHYYLLICFFTVFILLFFGISYADAVGVGEHCAPEVCDAGLDCYYNRCHKQPGD